MNAVPPAAPAAPNPKLKAALDDARKILDLLASPIETIVGEAPAAGPFLSKGVALLKSSLDAIDGDVDGGVTSVASIAIDVAKAAFAVLV